MNIGVEVAGDGKKPCALRLANICTASEGSIVRTSVGSAVEKDAGATTTVTVTTSTSFEDVVEDDVAEEEAAG